MIIPTVGRKVWYRASEADADGTGEESRKMAVHADEPLDATVVAVWGDRCINLVIFDVLGFHHTRRSVKLVQEGDELPAGGRYAEWMPYQNAQAKK